MRQGFDWRVLMLASLVTGLVALPAVAAPRDLQRVGALDCLSHAANTGAPHGGGTRLVCELHLYNDKPPLELKGTMFGRGVYLVSPGGRHVVWSVLAPVENIESTAVAGTYDTRSAHHFPYVKERSDVLAGGLAGSIVLQLVEPTIEAIGPATRLELHVAKTASERS